MVPYFDCLLHYFLKSIMFTMFWRMRLILYHINLHTYSMYVLTGHKWGNTVVHILKSMLHQNTIKHPAHNVVK